jgi:hypothetical protein
MITLQVLLGVTVVVATTLDMLLTAVRVDTPSGPLTRVVTRGLWTATRRVPRWRRDGPPSATGLAIAITVLATWLALLVAGWFLVFSAAPGAVVDDTTAAPADLVSRLYYTGYVVSTLGIGDYTPGGPGWQTATALAAVSGLSFATLVITYLSAVTGAVVSKRQVGRSIAALGTTPEQVVRRSWDGERFSTLDDHLVSLAPSLDEMAAQHGAYPILHYFRTDDRRAAHWPSVVTLSETLFVLDELVAEEVRPPELVVQPARSAIAWYLDSLPGPEDTANHEVPPAPDLERLAELGVPLRSRGEIDRAVRAAAGQRGRLLSVLQHQGWSWEQAVGPEAAG